MKWNKLVTTLESHKRLTFLDFVTTRTDSQKWKIDKKMLVQF